MQNTTNRLASGAGVNRHPSQSVARVWQEPRGNGRTQARATGPRPVLHSPLANESWTGGLAPVINRAPPRLHALTHHGHPAAATHPFRRRSMIRALLIALAAIALTWGSAAAAQVPAVWNGDIVTRDAD